MKDLNNTVGDRIADIAKRTLSKIETYAPENELTRQAYKNLTEDKLYMLVNQYGQQRVYNWILENQRRDENARTNW